MRFVTRHFVPLLSYTRPMSTTTSLDAALARVAHLERRLAEVESALQARHGSTVDDLLSNYRSSAGWTPPLAPTASAEPSATAEPTAETTAAEPAPSEPVDIQPYILKALALRKGVQSGTVEDGEVALDSLVVDSGLSPAQVEQLRQWAGL